MTCLESSMKNGGNRATVTVIVVTYQSQAHRNSETMKIAEQARCRAGQRVLWAVSHQRKWDGTRLRVILLQGVCILIFLRRRVKLLVVEGRQYSMLIYLLHAEILTFYHYCLCIQLCWRLILKNNLITNSVWQDTFSVISCASLCLRALLLD